MRGCACRGTAGVAHVSCLMEQAKILFAEAEENNLDWKVKTERWDRWTTCSLCEQRYHGVVACALGWACWKTYLGRPETDGIHRMAMNLLGNGLYEAEHHEAALSVREAELSTLRRHGGPADAILCVQGNLARTYEMLGRYEQALDLQRDVYSGRLKLNGEEHVETLREASSYSESLIQLKRYQEVKSLLRKTIPVARRVLRDDNILTLIMKWSYATALCNDPSATLDDVREAVTTLEDADRIGRRVFGGANPLTVDTEKGLRDARAALRARETPPTKGDS